MVGTLSTASEIVAHTVCDVGDDSPGGARNATTVSSSTSPGIARMMLSTATIVASSALR